MRRLLVPTATAALLGLACAFSATPALAATATTGATPTPTATTASAPAPGAPSASRIIATAQQYIGYPYAYIGDDPSTGFSCIGFVHYVYAQNGVYVPEDLGKAYASAPHVDQGSLQPGDLVFFQNTVWNGISHVGIYAGNGQVIAADSFQTGVEWDRLSDSYWQNHYLGATRPLADPSGTPPLPVPSTTPVPSGPSLSPQSSAPNLSVKAGIRLSARHAASVYSGPGSSYSVIDRVTPDTVLTAVQAQGSWVNVSYQDGNQYGWLRGADLNLPRASSGSGKSATRTGRDDSGQTLVVVSTLLGVYSGPAATAQPLLQLPSGMAVPVLRTRGAWDQIVLPDGTQGWVANKYLGPRGTVTAQPGPQSTQSPIHQVSSSRRERAQVVMGFHASRPDSQALAVTADVLYVRAAPSAHARILRRVHAGDRLRLLAARPGWDYVALRDSSRGWVSARWVQ